MLTYLFPSPYGAVENGFFFIFPTLLTFSRLAAVSGSKILSKEAPFFGNWTNPPG